MPDTGPGQREIEEAVASITGTPLPPNPDAAIISKLLQGLLAGIVMRESQDPAFPIKIRDVLMPQRDGSYEDHFVVVTESGIRIKVEVAPE